MSYSQDETEAMTRSGMEDLPIVLAALRQIGRPATLPEISAITGIHPVSLGGMLKLNPASIKRNKYHGSRKMAAAWILSPHPDIARHWPEWQAGKEVAA
jgi:hypothetical protein